jgi:glycosyltransferase involved in cell wall biosynthesis
MACERIVIATDSGGVREVLKNYGTLIPINNNDDLEIRKLINLF